MIPFQLAHNAEIEAVDLLMEVEQLEQLPQRLSTAITESKSSSSAASSASSTSLPRGAIDPTDTAHRVIRYIISAAEYQPDRDHCCSVLSIAYSIAVQIQDFPTAMRIALRMGDRERMSQCYTEAKQSEIVAKEPSILKQLLWQLAGHRVVLDELRDDEDAMAIMGNSKV